MVFEAGPSHAFDLMESTIDKNASEVKDEACFKLTASAFLI
jgi:hypothetical protein